jgi:hypothetical protein
MSQLAQERLFIAVLNRHKSRHANLPALFGSASARDERLWLDTAAFQFGFNRVKDELDRHHCKSRPEDDRSPRGD